MPLTSLAKMRSLSEIADLKQAVAKLSLETAYPQSRHRTSASNLDQVLDIIQDVASQTILPRHYALFGRDGEIARLTIGFRRMAAVELAGENASLSAFAGATPAEKMLNQLQSACQSGGPFRIEFEGRATGFSGQNPSGPADASARGSAKRPDAPTFGKMCHHLQFCSAAWLVREHMDEIPRHQGPSDLVNLLHQLEHSFHGMANNQSPLTEKARLQPSLWVFPAAHDLHVIAARDAQGLALALTSKEKAFEFQEMWRRSYLT
ncbi:hypothetical protein [Marimonas lutisalis]|uniref:hypothetical protein n=1 Tax=Marimonas lutisalis TaxID=2545756 RepID=UPI0010F77725|nr:hypothetical protein [Marimonas lutisalis]